MSSSLRVSLVLPAYNEADYLAACLEAIAQQTLKPFEVIVVNNNSTDKTVDIATSYEFVRLINENKQGIVYARDAGFNAARGEVIARIDADTILTPTWVEQITQFFADEKMVAVTGRGNFVDVAAGKSIGVLQTFTYQSLQRMISRTYTLWGSNMALRRDAWLQTRKYCSKNSLLDEDIDLTLCLQSKKYRIDYKPNLLVYASLRRGDLSTGAVVKYTYSWSRNYVAQGRNFEARVIALLRLVVIVLTLPYTAYYSARKRIGSFVAWRNTIIDKIFQY